MIKDIVYTTIRKQLEHDGRVASVDYVKIMNDIEFRVSNVIDNRVRINICAEL